MSYSTARAQIVQILQAITPSDTTVFQTRFQHMAKADGKNVTSRSFWLEANRDGPGVIRGPDLINIASTPGPLHVITMTLTVHYRDHSPRQHEVDVALESDRTDVSLALLNQANWARTTSGIENVCNGRDFMQCQRADGVSGGTELRFILPLTFR